MLTELQKDDSMRRNFEKKSYIINISRIDPFDFLNSILMILLFLVKD